MKQQKTAHRAKRVTTHLNSAELRALRKVRRYVGQFCGIETTAEALRFLIRNWEAS